GIEARELDATCIVRTIHTFLGQSDRPKCLNIDEIMTWEQLIALLETVEKDIPQGNSYKWRLLFIIGTYIHRFRLLFHSYYRMVENDNFTTNSAMDHQDYHNKYLYDTKMDSSTQVRERDSDISDWWLEPVIHSSNKSIKQIRHQNETTAYLLNPVDASRKILANVKHTYEQLKEHVTYLDNNNNNNNNNNSFDKKRKNERNKIWNSLKKQGSKYEQRFYCNEEPVNLKGRVLNENSSLLNLTLYDIEMNYSNIRSGGSWAPPNLNFSLEVAIIIPYRDRLEQLTILLYYLHPILQRQELDYKIYVSEQTGNDTYNKGISMNAAFIYASSEYDFQCYVFHDVDLIPEDDRNMYSCPLFPRHMSVAINEMDY
ncbi:unnamed protein product, partial [Didymodactylos carnosus]